MRTLHLFAGAGGGLLADLILGHTPVAAVEWDAYCCQVLRERAEEGWFPGLRVHEGDVRLFDPSEYAGRVDCIHAGFPCQPYSFAGRRAGIDDPRGGDMWNEVVRICRVVRPRVVFLENVGGFVSLGLGTVLGDLAALGFDAKWTCLSAARVGAPHLRERWWLYGHANQDGKSDGSINDETRVMQGVEGSNAVSVSGEGLQPVRLDQEGRQGSDERQAGSLDVCESWWTTEPAVGRVVDGMASRVDRLKALGNGQVPLQAALAWKILTRIVET